MFHIIAVNIHFILNFANHGILDKTSDLTTPDAIRVGSEVPSSVQVECESVSVKTSFFMLR